MSTGLIIRLYSDEEVFKSVDRFKCVIRACDTLSEVSKSWDTLRVSKDYLYQTVFEERGPVDVPSLLRLASMSRSDSGQCHSASGQLQLGHNINGTDNLLIISVKTWDSDAKSLDGVDRRISGCGEIVIESASPFWGIMDADNEFSLSGAAGDRNLIVADNLRHLERLVIAMGSGPFSAIKVFVDAGWLLPHNSHYSFFSSNAAVLSDLALEARLWKDGLDELKVPPLSNYQEGKHQFCLSDLRSSNQRRELWSALARLIPMETVLDEECVRIATELTSQNVTILKRGYTVCTQPFFLNSFVDEFYLDVLEVGQLERSRRQME